MKEKNTIPWIKYSTKIELLMITRTTINPWKLMMISVVLLYASMEIIIRTTTLTNRQDIIGVAVGKSGSLLKY
jgi:hypothetical protein